MTGSLTRRHLVRATGTAALFTALPWSSSRAIAQNSGEVWIGDDASMFEDVLGAGLANDVGMVQFGDVADGGFVYYVHFTDDLADAIEIDYAYLPDGGLSENEAMIGQSRFVPEGAEPGASFMAGQMSYGTKYHLQVWGTERVGTVLVIDEENSIGDGEDDNVPFKGAWVAVQSPEVIPVTPVGDGVTLGGSKADWGAAYGQGFSPARGYAFQNAPFDGLSIELDGDGRVVEIDIEAHNDSEAISTADAFTFVGEHLPYQVSAGATFVTQPSPRTGRSIRTHVWGTPSTRTFLFSFVEFEGREEDGTATRVLIGSGYS